jgi:ABC-type amino acid transport substrate-binding protein
MRRLLHPVAVAVLLAAGAAAANDGTPPLTVCLNKDNKPFSYSLQGQTGGFDLAVAQAVARRLQRPLDVRWYEKERRRRGAVSVKTSVLVSAGVCQLVGGFPLVQSSLERPAGGEETTLPPVDGMGEESRKKPVKGSQLFASDGYHFAAVTPVLGQRVSGAVRTLDDLQPYRIVNRPASSGDLIVMAYKKGQLLKNASHVDIMTEPLDAVARGDADATIVESHRFDMYRVEQPQSPLRGSGLMLPIGFNLGFVTTADHAGLLRDVNAALDALRQSGELEQAARAEKLTYIAPIQPYVRTGLGLEKMVE